MNALVGFLDESGFSERPSIRRTWAPRGQTPIIRDAFSWKRLAAIGTLVTTPAGRRIKFFLGLRNGTVRAENVIAYLKGLKRSLRGRRLVLIWDSLPAHKSRKVGQYLLTQKNWLQIELLPSYAPELNPVEYAWSYISGTDMANFCADHLGQVRRQVRRARCRIQKKAGIARSFLKHSGLF